MSLSGPKEGRALVTGLKNVPEPKDQEETRGSCVGSVRKGQERRSALWGGRMVRDQQDREHREESVRRPGSCGLSLMQQGTYRQLQQKSGAEGRGGVGSH